MTDAPAVPTPPAASGSVPLRTPLHALHLEHGARMVPFAGHELPVTYPAGLIAEHRHTRRAASLFDVSHMGQIVVEGEGAGAALESLMPVDLLGLAPGRQRYAFLLTETGGILDDLMVLRRPDDWLLVVNGAGRQSDLEHLQRHIGHRCRITARFDRALLALQGPQAVAALARLEPAVAALRFMQGGAFELDGIPATVTRSGYTGEDGFEIGVEAGDAEPLARRLLAHPEVALAGLGARDTLRLEAGLCLHGHDIDAGTTPIEAGLDWAIQKVRRPGGERAGGHLGAEALATQWRLGAPMRRVGLGSLDRTPVREGARLFLTHPGGGASSDEPVGRVTSGTVSPTLERPVCMARLAATVPDGAALEAEVRGRRVPLERLALPFVPHRYHRG